MSNSALDYLDNLLGKKKENENEKPPASAGGSSALEYLDGLIESNKQTTPEAPKYSGRIYPASEIIPQPKVNLEPNQYTTRGAYTDTASRNYSREDILRMLADAKVAQEQERARAQTNANRMSTIKPSAGGVEAYTDTASGRTSRDDILRQQRVNEIVADKAARDSAEVRRYAQMGLDAVRQEWAEKEQDYKNANALLISNVPFYDDERYNEMAPGERADYQKWRDYFAEKLDLPLDDKEAYEKGLKKFLDDYGPNGVAYTDSDGNKVTYANLYYTLENEQNLKKIANDPTLKQTYETNELLKKHRKEIERIIERADGSWADLSREDKETVERIAKRYGVDRVTTANTAAHVMNLITKKIDENAAILDEAGYDYERVSEYERRQREAEEIRKNAAKTKKFAEDHPVLATLLTIIDFPVNLIGGAATLLTGKGSATPEDAGYYVPFNTNTNAVSRFNQTVTSAVAEKFAAGIKDFTGSDFLAWVAKTGYTGVSSFAHSAAVTLTLNSLFGPVGAKLGLALLGTEAGMNGLEEAARRGVSNGKAVMYGLASGINEALFEEVSLDRFLKMDVSRASLAKAFKESLLQGGVEASEEFFTTLANTAADRIINTNLSEYNANVAKYVKSGMSDAEAKRKATLDFCEGLAEDAFGGFVGGSMGAGGKILGTFISERADTAKQIRNAVRGIDADKSVVRKIANGKELTTDEAKLVIADPTTSAAVQELTGMNFAGMTLKNGQYTDTYTPAQVQNALTRWYESGATPVEQTESNNYPRISLAQTTPTQIATDLPSAQMQTEGVLPSDEINANNGEITALEPMVDKRAEWDNMAVEFGEQGREVFDGAFDDTLEGAELVAIADDFRRFYNAGRDGMAMTNDFLLAAEETRIPAVQLLGNIEAADLEAAAYEAGRQDALTNAEADDIITSDNIEGGNTYGRQESGVRVRGGAVRGDVQSTRGQTREVRGEQTQNQGGREGNVGRGTSGEIGQNVRSVQKRAVGEKVSPKQLGIRSGSDASNVVMKAGDYAIREAAKLGIDVTAVKGALRMKDGVVDGVSYRDSRTGRRGIVYQGDSKLWTEKQFIRHEGMHVRIAQGKVGMNAISDAIKRLNKTDADVRTLFDAYLAKYGDIYDDSVLLEEIFCDAYAAMDRFGVEGARKAMDTIRREFGKAYEASRSAEVDAAVAEGKAISLEDELNYSRAHDAEYMEAATEYNRSHGVAIPANVMRDAAAARKAVLDYMNAHEAELLLPEDIEGKNWFGNNSYGGTLESTTVCTRSLAAQTLMDMVSEQLGRPLAVKETLFLSQDMMNYTSDPECVYCYVAADRRAYREFLGEYIKQRDAALKDIKSGVSKQEAYERFLGTRKDTKNMRSRFNMWLNTTDLIIAKDLASLQKLTFERNYLAGLRNKTEAQKSRYNQLKDAMAYAQSASWAKKMVGFTAYNGEILTWAQKRIDELNSHYGARMYSFSDFSPAFILENMQQVTDASVRGLKMFSYNKAIDFVKIFAPTGMNFNVSVFGYEQNGQVAEDAMQGVPWKEAQELRAEYPGVGIVFVATNDTLVDWAKQQDWIDVVIPYHTVRTGKVVADFFGYKDYKQVQEDGKIPGVKYEKGAKKSIYPAEHQNDIVKYVKALEKNDLTPRFPEQITGWREFLNGEMTEQEFRAANPYYMKFVNETRRAPQDTPAVQPVFDTDAAISALEKMAKQGGYNPAFGGSIETMNELADEFTENIRRRNAEEVAENDGDVIRYSRREEAPPKKTKTAYKLMRLVDNKLYPLFIGNNEAIDIGTWYNADSPNLSQLKSLPAGTHLVDMKTGKAISWERYARDKGISRSNPNAADIRWANENGKRFMLIEDKTGAKSEKQMREKYGDARAYYNWGINGSAKSETGEGSPSIYALRPGWHFGEVPSMHQIGYGDDKDTRLDNQVWVEAEMSADKDYNDEARSNATGDIPTHIPTDGYYTYATNPTQKKSKSGTNSDKADWYVAGAFKVNRILSDPEADEIVRRYNAETGKNVPLDYRRAGGRVFNADTMRVEDADRYSREDSARFNELFATLDDGRIVPKDVEALNKSDWDKIYKAVKKLGYDITSAEDAKEAYSDYVGESGFNDEQSKAIKRAFGAAPAAESLANPERVKAAEKEFGTTTDFREAGYLLPDGKMLDFSGKKDSGPARTRSMDHREISSVFDEDLRGDRYGDDTAYMNAFISEGNIRLMDDVGVTMGETEPTAQQYSVLERFIDRVTKNNDGYFYLDISNNKGNTIESREYEGDSVSRILREIKEYYKNGELPYRSDLQQYRFSREGINAGLAGDAAQMVSDLRRQLREANARLANAKGQLKRTEQPTVRSDDARRISRDIIKRYDSKASVDGISKAIEDLGNLIVRGSDENGDATYTRIKEAASDIMYNIISMSDDVYDADAIEVQKQIRSKLQSTKFYVSEYEAGDLALGYENYNDFRRRNFGNVKTTSDPKAMRVDAFYEEVCGQFPWMFDTGLTNQADQLKELIRVSEMQLKPTYNIAEESEVEAYDLLERVMSTELRQVRTFADKAARRQELAVAHELNKESALKERIAALKDEIEREKQKRRDELKVKRAVIEEERERFRDYKRTQAEKRREREASDRLLKMIKRVNKMDLNAPNRAWFEQHFGDIYTLAKTLTGNKIASMDNLEKRYGYLKEHDQDFIGSDRIENQFAEFRNKQRDITSMTEDEIAAYTTTLLMFEKQVREGDKMTRIADRTNVRMMAYNVISDVNATKGVKPYGVVAKIEDALITNTLDAVRSIRRYTGYNDGDPLYQRTLDLARGQQDVDIYVTKAREKFANLLADKKFTKWFTGPNAAEINVTVKDALTGEESNLTITPALRTALYLNNQNDDNRRHITYGGIVFPDVKLLKKGDFANAYAKGKTIRLTPTEISKITRDMTSDEKNFARVTNSYFSEMSAPEIERVHEELFGVPPKMVGAGYYPLKVVKGYLRNSADETFDINADTTSGAFDIGSPGWLKERVTSEAPIYLFPVDRTVNTSIEQHGKYVGLAIPYNNFNKLWNAALYKKTDRYDALTQQTKSKYIPNIEVGTVRENIEAKWGQKAGDTIQQFLDQITGKEKTGASGIFGRLRSNYAGAVLELNPSTALKQAPSGIAAAAVVGWWPLAKALTPALKVDTSFVDKMTAAFLIRKAGYSSQELGELADRGKKLPPALSWIIGADLATTSMLKRAAAFYVLDNTDLAVGSDEYKRAVVDVYQQIISETQPTYDVLYRSKVLRSKNQLVRALNMFRTQPYKNFNILYDSLGNLQAKRNAYHEANRWATNNEQSQRYAEEAKAAYHDAKKRVIWAFSSQAVAGLMISLIMSGWDMLRGRDKKYRDDDGEITFWSFLKGLGINFASTGAGMIPGGSVILESVESLVDIFAKDDVFGTTAYGFSVPEVDLLNDTISGVGKLAKTLYNEVAAEDGANWENIGRAIYSSIEQFTQFAGVPLENARKTLEVMARQIFKSQGYFGDYLALRIAGTPDENKAEYYDLLYKAYGDNEAEYDKLYKQLVSDGYSESAIKSAMETRMKKAQGVDSVDDLSSRYLSPSQQKTYDAVTRRVKSSEVWAESDASNRAKLSEIAYDVIAGSKRNTWKSESITTENDLTQTEYILYKLALDVVDKPNSNGKYGTYTDDEKEKAVKMAKKG